MGRSVTGAALMTERRQRFAALIEQGVSNAEACRQVGVHIRTGMRWQRGRKVVTERGEVREYPPVLSEKLRVLSARYPSEDERVVIADMLRLKRSLRAIAAALAGGSRTSAAPDVRVHGSREGALDDGRDVSGGWVGCVPGPHRGPVPHRGVALPVSWITSLTASRSARSRSTAAAAANSASVTACSASLRAPRRPRCQRRLRRCAVPGRAGPGPA